ncbi:MAG: hypothetical protein R3F35_12800 [Myxococcota bacterium]
MTLLRNALCLAIGFVVVASAAGRWMPARPVAIVSAKLSRYARAGPSIDVLAIGSSLTYRQIVPRIFDETTREAGRPLHLFNLGIDGMRPPEDTFVLERALASRVKPPEVVLVEVERIRFRIRPQDVGTDRLRYWHDARRMASLARFALASAPGDGGLWGEARRLGEATPTLARHLVYWVQNRTAVGRGQDALLEALLGPEPVADEIGVDGYDPPPPRAGLTPRELDAYRAALARRSAGGATAPFGDAASQAELEQKRRIIERVGARMLLIVPPDPMARRFLPKDAALRAETIDFGDPSAYPALYAPARRRDPSHLDEAGAALYTRLLARRVVEKLASRP